MVLRVKNVWVILGLFVVLLGGCAERRETDNLAEAKRAFDASDVAMERALQLLEDGEYAQAEQQVAPAIASAIIGESYCEKSPQCAMPGASYRATRQSLLGFTRFMQGDFSGAVAACEQVTGSFAQDRLPGGQPRPAEQANFKVLVLSHMALGNKDEAISYFAQLSELDPAYAAKFLADLQEMQEMRQDAQ